MLLPFACTAAQADLPFQLPPKAKYTASAASIATAKDELSTSLATDAGGLTNLFVSPMMCGPGLWDVLKSSPCFSTPPKARTTVKIPAPDGSFKEWPAALLQSAEEVVSFRKALADLLKTQGKLIIREPNREEFMTYWAAIPFDEIDGPLLVVDGKDVTLFFQFERSRVFWADEVKRMRSRKQPEAGRDKTTN